MIYSSFLASVDCVFGLVCRALSSKQCFPQAHGNLAQLWERNQRAYENLAKDAGQPIGGGRDLTVAMEALSLRFEKAVMTVYERQAADDFSAIVDNVVADLVRLHTFHTADFHTSGS